MKKIDWDELINKSGKDESNRALGMRYEQAYEHDKWRLEIPFTKFPPDWEIQIVPPFCWAVVRFRARCNDKDISVYLDCYENLGYFGGPYWEAYPIKGDTARFALQDMHELIETMKQEFERKEDENRETSEES